MACKDGRLSISLSLPYLNFLHHDCVLGIIKVTQLTAKNALRFLLQELIFMQNNRK